MKLTKKTLEIHFQELVDSKATSQDIHATIFTLISKKPEARTLIMEVIKKVQAKNQVNLLSFSYLPLTTLPEPRYIAKSLTLEIIPPLLRSFVKDITERLQTEIEFSGGPLIVFMSAELGIKFKISPKELDEWVVTPNVWGYISATAGRMKTPVVNAIKNLFSEIEAEHTKQYREEVIKSKAIFGRLESKRRAIIAKMDTEFKSKDKNPSVIEELEIELQKIEREIEESRPKQRRFVVQDATVEALQLLMADNNDCLMYYRDELIGLLLDLEKPGRESALAFLLECWGGDSNFKSDRVGRGLTEIEICCISILGTIQPSVLENYIYNKRDSGSAGDGFLERFQVIFSPEMSTEFKFVDRKPDYEAIEVIKRVIIKIYQAKKSIQGHVLYKYNPEAQVIFNNYLTNLENRLRNLPLEEMPMESHLSKFRSLVPSLSLIFQVLEDFSSDDPDLSQQKVSTENLKLAILWAEVLESHAIKILHPPVRPGSRTAKLLAVKIQDGALPNKFTARDLIRKNWSELNKQANNDLALEILCEYGWLFKDAKNTFHINPKVFDMEP